MPCLSPLRHSHAYYYRKLGPRHRARSARRPFSCRTLFKIPNIRWCLLLVLPPRLSEAPCIAQLGEWLDDFGRCLDCLSQCHIRCVPGLVYIRKVTIDRGFKGVTQLTIALIEIYHPELTMSPWQTCKFLRDLDNMSDISIDLIFFAITVFTSIPSLFFNSILPTIDVSAKHECPSHNTKWLFR